MENFFISYNKADAFQAKIIYNWLEDEGYSCTMQDIDFAAGSNFILEMHQASKYCKRTIAILSTDYLASVYVQPEWAAALAKDPTGEKRLLIPVRVRECKPGGLLSQIVYIDLVGLSAIERKEKFLCAIQEVITGKKSKHVKGVGKKMQTEKMAEKPLIKQEIKGDKNIQVAGDLIIADKPPNKIILPSSESIGADPLLKQNIKVLFNKIGESRENRFGKRAYSVMYNKFKTDFGIKNEKWTIIWDWPKECAPAILHYLQEKYNNTIVGRIERAVRRSDYLHTRPHLYKKEKEFLEHLGLEMKSTEVKKLLKEYFGVESHRELTHLAHWQWVCYLEGRVQRLEEN